VYALAFSPDGTTVAAGGADRTVSTWRVTDSGAPVRVGAPGTGHQGAVYGLTYAGDGRVLASASADGAVLLWDAADPTGPHRRGPALVGGGGPMYAVASPPDGHRLGAVGEDGLLRLWSLADPGAPRPVGVPLTIEGDALYAVGFSTDGAMVTAAGAGGGLALWDVSADVPRAVGRPLASGTGRITAVALGRDRLVTGEYDGRSTLWRLQGLADVTAAPVERACAALGRGLDQDEWAARVPDVAFEVTCPAPS
jgi:WD40 repeat protein